MARKQFVVAGTGLSEIIRLCEDFCSDNPDYEFIGFVDDNTDNRKRELYGYPLLGDFTYVAKRQVLVVNSIARTTEVRKLSTERLKSLQATFMNLVHPSTTLDANSIGTGNVVDRGCIIHRGARIGSHNMFLTNVVVGHDSIIGDNNFIGHHCVFNGFVTLGSDSYIGGASIFSPGTTVGSGCNIGMGCNISTNVASGSRLISRPPLTL